MGLRFDYTKAMQEYMKIFETELNIALDKWEKEVENNVLSDYIKKHRKPEAKAEIKRMKRGILVYFKVNPAIMMDSYGTGSAMNTRDNPLFSEYRRNVGSKQGQWNPARRGNSTEIVGRPKGEYVNIFGEHKKTSGNFEGRSLEYLKVGGGKYKERRIISTNFP